MKIDRILKDFDQRKLQEGRNQQAPPTEMEYVQYTQNARPKVEGRIYENDIDLYENAGNSKLDIFLRKMKEWQDKIDAIEMKDSIYEMPIRQKINTIYNQFG